MEILPGNVMSWYGLAASAEEIFYVEILPGNVMSWYLNSKLTASKKSGGDIARKCNVMVQF